MMNDDPVNTTLSAIEHLHHAGYWLALFETTLAIGLILLGSTVILVLGALAARGDFDPGILVGFAFLGAVVGDNVFEQFYRVEKSRSLEYGGAGLGLAMVEKIVRMHEGVVRMDSREGEWAKITIVLPVSARMDP